MSSRRTAILIGAIAVGIIAVVLIWQYVRNVENSLYADSQPVTVYIATDTVARGTDGQVALDSKAIQTTDVPQKYRPTTAITSADALQKKVALFDISPGTIIVNGMFVDPATSQISFRQRLKNKTHVAISIQVDQVKGVGGFLVPGDEVNMMIMQDNNGYKETVDAEIRASTAAPTGTASGALGGEMKRFDHPPQNFVQTGGPQWLFLDKTARYMYQKVQILAVGSTQLLSPGEQASQGSSTAQQQNNTGLITFNVPAKAAQWIATGAEKGFYLSLVPKDYQADGNLGPLPIVVDTLPGEDQTKLCPYVDAAGLPDCAPKG